MHESSAFFCSAFDRKRHFKPEVTGRRHRAPRCSAIPRHCQQGRRNKIKGLAKNAVWDFQAGKEHVLEWPGHGEGLVCAAPSKSKLLLKPDCFSQGQLFGLCSAARSARWEPGRRDPARAKIRTSEPAERGGGHRAGLGKSRRSQRGQELCPRSQQGKENLPGARGSTEAVEEQTVATADGRKGIQNPGLGILGTSLLRGSFWLVHDVCQLLQGGRGASLRLPPPAPSCQGAGLPRTPGWGAAGTSGWQHSVPLALLLPPPDPGG